MPDDPKTMKRDLGHRCSGSIKGGIMGNLSVQGVKNDQAHRKGGSELLLGPVTMYAF